MGQVASFSLSCLCMHHLAGCCVTAAFRVIADVPGCPTRVEYFFQACSGIISSVVVCPLLNVEVVVLVVVEVVRDISALAGFVIITPLGAFGRQGMV